MNVGFTFSKSLVHETPGEQEAHQSPHVDGAPLCAVRPRAAREPPESIVHLQDVMSTDDKSLETLSKQSTNNGALADPGTLS